MEGERKGKCVEMIPTMYQYQHSSIATPRADLTQRALDPTPGSATCWLGSLGERGHPPTFSLSLFTYSMFMTTVLPHQGVLRVECKLLPSA